MSINHILLDLEVIKQLVDYDKLGVLTLPGSTKLCVDSYGYTSAITRWYNNYNRETSITYLEELTNNIEKTSDFIISGQHNDEGETLREAIDSALHGLEKLKITYISDSIIVARINNANNANNTNNTANTNINNNT